MVSTLIMPRSASNAGLPDPEASAQASDQAVEEALYRHREPLFGGVSITFFHTAILSFEGVV